MDRVPPGGARMHFLPSLDYHYRFGALAELFFKLLEAGPTVINFEFPLPGLAIGWPGVLLY